MHKMRNKKVVLALVLLCLVNMSASVASVHPWLPSASVNEGVSHACGHDMHSTILLSTAQTLSSMQKQISGIMILGNEMVMGTPRTTAREDFARYMKIAPSCYLNFSTGSGVTYRHPVFNPDERASITGVKAEVQIIPDYLDQN